jgi:hypothetical protein
MKLGRLDVERGEQMLSLRVRNPNGLRITAIVFLGFALATGLAGRFAPPITATLLLIFLGVFGVVLSAVLGDKLASKGILQRVSRSLELRPSDVTGYRDGGGMTLTVDGETFDAKRIRAVTIRTIDNGKGRDIVNVYLALDDRAFVVDSSMAEEPMRDLADELREALEALELETPDDDGEPEPLRATSIFVVVGVMLAELAAMVPALLPAASGRDGSLSLRDAFLGPLVIAIVTFVFAWLYRLCCSWLVRRRASEMFGVARPAGTDR